MATITPITLTDSTPEKKRKAGSSKFFQTPESSPTSGSATTSPASISPFSPTTASAEKKLRTFSLFDAETRSPPPRVSRRLSFETSYQTAFRVDEIREIRFSQDSISCETSEEESLESLIESMKKNGWAHGKAAINIVKMPDGKYTSLDNRRLYAMMQVIKTHPRFRLPVTIYDHTLEADEKGYRYPISRALRSREATLRVATLQKLIKEQNIKPDSWGYCVYARMRAHTATMPPDSCYGYSEPPVIRGVRDQE